MPNKTQKIITKMIDRIEIFPDEVKIEAAKRYITAYEMITGKEFEAKNEDVLKRIESNLRKFYGKNA